MAIVVVAFVCCYRGGDAQGVAAAGEVARGEYWELGALANVAIRRPAALDRDCLVLASALQPLASAVLKRAYPSLGCF